MWIELLASSAWAAACCMGTTTTTPVRVGECERVAVGVSASGEHTFARWDGDGRPAPPAPGEEAVVGTLAAGWRWSRSAQLQVALPTRWTWRDAASLTDDGGGVGDLSVGVLWDPVEES